MFDIRFKGAVFSIIESKNCNLKYMSKSIDEVVEEYTKRTTVAIDNFNFSIRIMSCTINCKNYDLWLQLFLLCKWKYKVR